MLFKSTLASFAVLASCLVACSSSTPTSSDDGGLDATTVTDGSTTPDGNTDAHTTVSDSGSDAPTTTGDAAPDSAADAAPDGETTDSGLTLDVDGSLFSDAGDAAPE